MSSPIKEKIFPPQTFVVYIFFLVIFIVGLFFYNDYGLHWDSMAQYEIGKVNLDYMLNKNDELLEFTNRYYGPAFEMVLVALTGHLPLREMFFFRHALSFLFFFIGLFCFFKLIVNITHDWRLGLAGCLMLVLSPRIFTESYYNTKDIPFMSMFIICVYSLNRLSRKTDLINSFFHILSSAFLIAIRLHGIFIILLTALLFTFLFIEGKTKKITLLINGFFSLIFTSFFVILFIPVLWQNPVREFITGLRIFSDYPWLGGLVLYRGVMVDAQNLPWHYIPVWVAITTPIIISLLFIIGIIKLSINLITAKINNFMNDLWFYFAIIWIGLPVFAVVLLKSVLYDGWRHLYFIYPAYLLISIYGLRILLNSRLSLNISEQQYRFVVYLFFILGLSEPIIFMMTNHPFEYVFFNRLAGKDYSEIKQDYEMDYWGLSYFNAFKDLLALDDKNKIKVLVENDPGDFNILMLPPEDESRLILVDDYEEADYFVTNYRWHPQEYDFEPFHSIRVRNASINTIYRIRNNS